MGRAHDHHQVPVKEPAPVTGRFTSYRTSDAAGPQEIADAVAWKTRYFLSHYPGLMPRDRAARILEIGCGYGVYVKAMQDLGYTNCSGIDLSEEQVGMARSELGLDDLVRQADASPYLAEEPASYDCILALDVLEHLSTEEVVTLGADLRRALKPGGTLIVQVPNGMAPLNPIRYGDFTHERAFTVQSLNQFFDRAGLVPVGCRPVFPHAHSTLSVVQRALWRGVLSPLIGVFVLLMYGRVPGNIYTMNLIGVGQRAPSDVGGPSTVA